MDNSFFGRSIKLDQTIRCDFDFTPIEKGKYALQVTGDETVKCQGMFHSRRCWEGAKANFEENKDKVGEV